MAKEVTILKERVDRDFLPFVRRPSRYIGGEVNQVRKDLSAAALTVGLCFPDIYEVGMSNTGLAIIYDILNSMPDVAAERIFAPWIDAEAVLRDKKIPLFTLESKAALKSFDCIGFALTNELCYTNVLNILDLGGLEVRSKNRRESDPLIIAGGGMANCCEPVAEFIDLFVLGEGEEAVVQLAKLLLDCKRAGLRKERVLLEAATRFNWAYAPSLYQFEYEDSKITALKPASPELPTQLSNAVVEDFENAPVPLRPIVPFAKAVHERVSVEIMRGCPGRCRFCQASFCRRPIRFRSVERILDIAKASYHSTGFDTVSLLSLSTADYPDIDELVGKLHGYFKDRHVGLSLPSLRVDQQLNLLPAMVTSVRKAGLTIAVEAASERLRQIINKPLKDEDLFAAVEAAYRAGWQRLKLYFMAGLPGETEEDIRDIVTLSHDLARLRKNVDGKTGQITAAVSWFVPKPHTPFAWLPQRSMEYFRRAKGVILDEKKYLRAKFLQFKFHDPHQSILESAIGRGDRRLCDVIEGAWRRGAKFDLWNECFDHIIWEEAFEEAGFGLEACAERQFDEQEALPWEHLGGPGKEYLLGHLRDSLEKMGAGGEGR
jgi:radical SAM family uncharacterized protein